MNRADAATRHLVVTVESGVESPNVADIVEHLSADPDLAAAVFDALRTSKILRPWTTFTLDGEAWWTRDSLDDEPAGHELVQDPATQLWFDGADEGQLVGWTLAEGMQHLDARARERGVLLAGGVPDTQPATPSSELDADQPAPLGGLTGHLDQIRRALRLPEGTDADDVAAAVERLASGGAA